jgi:hypothetical protein
MMEYLQTGLQPTNEELTTSQYVVEDRFLEADGTLQLTLKLLTVSRCSSRHTRQLLLLAQHTPWKRVWRSPE